MSKLPYFILVAEKPPKNILKEKKTDFPEARRFVGIQVHSGSNLFRSPECGLVIGSPQFLCR